LIANVGRVYYWPRRGWDSTPRAKSDIYDCLVVLCEANGNRYEGSWSNGVKNGSGKFFYLDKGQVYEGTWVDDLARCGQMKDWNRETAPDATPFPLPPVSNATASLHC